GGRSCRTFANTATTCAVRWLRRRATVSSAKEAWGRADSGACRCGSREGACNAGMAGFLRLLRLDLSVPAADARAGGGACLLGRGDRRRVAAALRRRRPAQGAARAV